MRLLPTTISVCLLAITGCLCACLLSLQATLAYAPRAFVETRAALVQETQATRKQALAQLSRVVDGDPKAKSAAGKLPLRELLVNAVNERGISLEIAAAGQLNQLRADLLEGDGSVAAQLFQQVTDTRSLLQPAVQAAVQTENEIDKTIADLHPQMLGLVAASKVTMGQAAQTAREIERATPSILTTVQKIGANSDAATAKTVAAAEESRQLLHNLAVNTTPLPKWIRYPAQIIGLIGSAALPVIGIAKLETAGTIASTIVQPVQK